MSHEAISFLIFIISLLVLFAVILIATSVSRRRTIKEEQAAKKEKEKDAIRRQMLRQELSALKAQYGKITLELPLQGAGVSWDDLSLRLIFFEESQIVYLGGRPIPFTKVLGCTLTDNQQTISTTKGVEETTVSTGSMIGRAIVGNMVAGRTGAIVGAATALQETSVNTTTSHSTLHDYVLLVNIDDLADPQRVLRFGKDMESANEAISAFNVIVHRNHASHN